MPNGLIIFLNSTPREKERAVRLFWNRVDKSSTPDGCWVWKSKNRRRFQKSPYGMFAYASICGQSFLMDAHRFSLSIVDWNERDLFVCHRCDNPPCVRPDHLWWGTHAQNMRDMTLKGRGRKIPRFLEIDDDIVAGASLEYDSAFSKGGRVAAMKAALYYGLNRVIQHGSVERAYQIENKRLLVEIEKWKVRVLQAESQKSSDRTSQTGS